MCTVSLPGTVYARAVNHRPKSISKLRIYYKDTLYMEILFY